MLGVLSYDHPHRKTEDVLIRLAVASPHADVTVFLLPWEERRAAAPLYPHRPTKTMSDPRELSDGLGFLWASVSSMADLERRLSRCEAALIAGCGILPPAVVHSTKIINAHPGYLPHIRGLDALKWAIYDGQPIGVTTHVIESEADCGPLIEQDMIRVHWNDSFHSVAQRQYEREVEMLVGAVSKPVKNVLPPLGEVRRRMKHWQEVVMMERFEERRRRA